MLPGRNNVYELDSGRHNIFSDEYDSDVSDGLSKRPYARHARRRLIYALFMTLGLLLVVHYRRDASFVLRPVTTSPGRWEHKEQKFILDLSHLEQYDLSSSFTYSRRSIEPKRTKGVRPTLTNVSEPLYGSQQVSVVSNGMLSRVSINALPPLPLSIPSDDRSSRFYAPSTHLDTSAISFGISTDLGRLNDSVPQLAHWLSDSDAELHVLVPRDDSSGNSTALEKNMNELGMKVTIAPTELTTVRAYFSLIKHLYERRTERTQWVALFDDDTFVPSLPQLVAHLNKNYDATEKKLVGALSDHINQISTWGLIPFGGGGIFISLPLAAQLSADEVYEDCIQSEQEQGDGILNECLQEWSEVRPTYDSLLNQMDLRGDVSGFFESGRKMLTIHHWKTWFNVDIPKVAKVSKACGDEGILMRFNFTNGAVLSNGFSIVDYGKEINNVDFDAIEKTWDGYARDFIHRIGPLREPLPVEEKKSYKMVGTVVLENGDVLQTYIYKAHNDDGSSSNKDDGVIELLWLN